MHHAHRAVLPARDAPPRHGRVRRALGADEACGAREHRRVEQHGVPPPQALCRARRGVVGRAPAARAHGCPPRGVSLVGGDEHARVGDVEAFARAELVLDLAVGKGGRGGRVEAEGPEQRLRCAGLPDTLRDGGEGREAVAGVLGGLAEIPEVPVADVDGDILQGAMCCQSARTGSKHTGK